MCDHRFRAPKERHLPDQAEGLKDSSRWLRSEATTPPDSDRRDRKHPEGMPDIEHYCYCLLICPIANLSQKSQAIRGAVSHNCPPLTKLKEKPPKSPLPAKLGEVGASVASSGRGYDFGFEPRRLLQCICPLPNVAEGSIRPPPTALGEVTSLRFRRTSFGPSMSKLESCTSSKKRGAPILGQLPSMRTSPTSTGEKFANAFQGIVPKRRDR